MMKRLTAVLCSVASLCLISVTCSAELSNYHANVTATRYGAVDIKAKGSTSFSLENGQWQIRISVNGNGLRSEEVSKGFVDNDIFKPETYHKLTKFLFFKENVNWNFNWSQKRVKGNVKKDKYEYNTGVSMHDPLSYQAPLRLALQNGETSLKYQYLRYNRPNTLTFEVIGEELLTLNNGRVQTLILKQTAPLFSGSKKLVWVAKDFDYIPVRFASYKNDKIKDDITVNRLWINGEEVSFNKP